MCHMHIRCMDCIAKVPLAVTVLSSGPAVHSLVSLFSFFSFLTGVKKRKRNRMPYSSSKPIRQKVSSRNQTDFLIQLPRNVTRIDFHYRFLLFIAQEVPFPPRYNQNSIRGVHSLIKA